VRDLAKSQPSAASPNATSNPISGSGTASATASSENSAAAAQPRPSAPPIAKANFELENGRYNSYYDQLKQWNEGYDQLIADIDDNLDRPILADAGIPESPVTIFQKQVTTVHCNKAVLEELVDHV
jgi:hypothetical protein